MQIMYYLFDSSPHEAQEGFNDLVAYSDRLGSLLEAERGSIWMIVLDAPQAGVPAFVAEYREPFSSFTPERDYVDYPAGWYHPVKGFPHPVRAFDPNFAVYYAEPKASKVYYK